MLKQNEHYILNQLLQTCIFNNFSVCSDTNADVTFVLDSSASISSADYTFMLEFLVNIVQRLNIGENNIHVAVVSFSENSRIDFLLDEHYDKLELVAAIRAIPHMMSTTHTASGLLDMRTKVFDPSQQNRRGDRNNVPNVAIVITDGESNINSHLTIPYADRAVADGIVVLAIGITAFIKETEIQGISSSGIRNDTYWLSPNFNVADEIVQHIVNRTCQLAVIVDGKKEYSVLVYMLLLCLWLFEPRDLSLSVSIINLLKALNALIFSSFFVTIIKKNACSVICK